MKYEQFKGLDTNAKLDVLYSMIENHNAFHSRINIFLLGILSAMVIVIMTGLVSKYLF